MLICSQVWDSRQAISHPQIRLQIIHVTNIINILIESLRCYHVLVRSLEEGIT